MKCQIFSIFALLSLLFASEPYADLDAVQTLISSTLDAGKDRHETVDALVGILSHADESWIKFLDEIPNFKLFMKNMTHEELAKIDESGSKVCSARWAIFSDNRSYDLNQRVNAPLMQLLRWALQANNDHLDFIKQALNFEVTTLSQPDICSLKTPDILEETLIAGRYENAAALANLFDLRMSAELYEKLSKKFGTDYAEKCTGLLDVSHEQYRLLDSILFNGLSILLEKLNAYEPCHIERLDGSTTLSVLVCIAARYAERTDKKDQFENYLAMIDDLLKEEEAVESAYLPFANESPITRAAESKDSRLLEVLCINGVAMNRPDGENGTPLHIALDLERFDTVQYLLEKHRGPIDINLRSNKKIFRSEIFSQMHPSGLTALDLAVQWNRPRFVWGLLLLGSTVYLEHYNLAKIPDEICQMLRVWSYFPQYMCWNAIDATDGLDDVLRNLIRPILNDPEFLLAHNFDFVMQSKK